jgi:hypothetical protein
MVTFLLGAAGCIAALIGIGVGGVVALGVTCSTIVE